MSKLPLYTDISKEEFEELVANAGYRKGTTKLIIDLTQHTVALKVGDVYYAEQFGNPEQANGKFRDLKSTIRNGGEL